MEQFQNPYRLNGSLLDGLATIPDPSIDAAAPLAMLARCPSYSKTPLRVVEGLIPATLWVKDERERMGLGSFKALGAAYVIAHAAMAKGGDFKTALAGEVYATASAGNHGLSVAAGAQLFGARAVIFLSVHVPEGFAERLRAMGADVIRAGDSYKDSMQAAQDQAEAQRWILLSDASWLGYTELPHRLMEGYLAMVAEAEDQVPQAPTHVFLQAGVGGLAGAVAAYARGIWPDAIYTVVEPELAPALIESIKAGRSVVTTGGVSDMGRLDCKEPSLIALRGLARDADNFVTLTEEEALGAMPALADVDLATSTSGGAGIVAAMLSDLPADARVFCILSEGPS